MDKGITIKQLSMQFGENRALDGIDLHFAPEGIYGLLGRNGAGKTTLLNLIANRLFPTQGEVLIDGEPVRENDRALSRVFYVGEKTLMPDTTTVKQMFTWTADFYPQLDMDYARRLADLFGLNMRKKLKSLSTGYLTIAKLILGLSCDAPYLLLDEPVLGLDANHRDLFYRELLANFAEQPRCIILSTHLIEEVADLINQVIIIKQGRILLDESSEAVKRLGYCVSGPAEAVERYCQGRQVLDQEALGGLRAAYLIGQPERCEGLQFTPLELQKLFIHLTNA